MAFAFDNLGMLTLASCVGLAATSASGCIATDEIEFVDGENFPPSAISQEDAAYPLREIGRLNLDDPVESQELPLEVIVRDPNIDQTLQYRIFLDSTSPPSSNEIPILAGTIDPQGEVDRAITFNVSYDLLTPGVCHKIELTISGAFFGFVEPRRPAEEGDIDNRTWWIEVIDADNPTIEFECQ